MPVDLPALVSARSTAVLTMEMQRGVIGDLAALPELGAEVAARQVIPRTATLVAAARATGARVVHCLAMFREDRAGSSLNAPMLAALTRRPGHMIIGSPEAELVPDLGPETVDLISPRLHGVSPFGGTSLDITLRNLGVTTVVAAGVSLNLGIIGLALEAVNAGYRVVVATDAVAGLPRDYADAVLQYTIPLIATRATVDEIVTAWSQAAQAAP